MNDGATAIALIPLRCGRNLREIFEKQRTSEIYVNLD